MLPRPPLLAGALLCSMISLVMLAAPRASALGLTLSESAFSNPGDPLTFTIGLDGPALVNGYDLTIRWDATELAFQTVADLSGLGLDTVPAGTTPAGERIATIELLPVSTNVLFQVAFQILAIDDDALLDFEVFADPVTNGAGISPGSLSLVNGATGVAFRVPEASTGTLLAAAIAGALAAGRRAWRRV